MAHTPGPWRFDEDGEVRAYDPADGWGDGTEIVDNIAVVYGEENGPLIAAAPELLRVAEAYLAWGTVSPAEFEKRFPEFAARDGTGGVVAIDAFAKSAIAKATGA